jgi:hypothetical protein
LSTFLRLEIICETYIFNVSANENVSKPSLKIGMINKKVPYPMDGVRGRSGAVASQASKLSTVQHRFKVLSSLDLRSGEFDI